MFPPNVGRTVNDARGSEQPARALADPRFDSNHPVSTAGDHDLDELLRAVAHAPAGRHVQPVPAGTRWGHEGRYVIDRLLGRGGMGVVYAADDTLLHRAVALKVLYDDAGEGAGEGAEPAGQRRLQRQRLLREARLAAQVEHPRIARVYDVGEHDGAAFVAMELVRGVTLRAWMTTEKRTAAASLAVVAQIAEGLAALHSRGVFHRDLKPENVMITDEQNVLLLDFGLARPTADAGAGVARHLPSRGHEPLSSWGQSGTVGYMAPEQCEGRPLDARVDVFALGVVTYELVAGHRPFVGEVTAAVVDATVRSEPTFSEEGWRLTSPALRAVVGRMLARDPLGRYSDGSEVTRALAKLHAPAIPTTQAPPARLLPRRGLAMGGLVVLVGLGGAAAWAVARTVRPALQAPEGMALIDVGRITVGKSRADIERECAVIGASCDRELMLRETPSVEVTVPPFFLDRYEVTNAEMGATLESLRGSLTVGEDEEFHYPRFVHWNRGLGHDDDLLADLGGERGGIDYVGGHYRVRPGRETLPAVQTTWHGAMLYCSSRGKVLPTEDEWEAAARGKENRAYAWGNGPLRCNEVVIPNDRLIPMPVDCPGKASLRPVGTSPQDVTPEGIHDLAGNATEWVNAVYVEGDRGARPADTAGLTKVMHGGSFAESLWARPSGRGRRVPNTAGDNLAFRCASHPAPR